MAWGSAQPIEKARFGQGNQRISLAFLWRNLAGFGKIWNRLGKIKSAPPSAAAVRIAGCVAVRRRRVAPREGRVRRRLGRNVAPGPLRVAEKGAQAIERFE
jgi:hypothetical protein